MHSVSSRLRLLRSSALPLVFAVAMGIIVAQAAQAQIVTDGTAGAVQTLTGPNYSIPQSLGTTNSSGTTLLQSFDQFNLATGQSATFTGASTLQAIIARVTGGAVSNIDGTLNVSTGNATDLYFLNPAGVVFGSNAYINVPGSFTAATANQVTFADSSVLTIAATPVGSLSTSAVASFGFLGAASGNITVNANTTTPTLGSFGGDLTLAGANVSISGRNLYAGYSETQRGQLRTFAVGNQQGAIGLRGAAGMSGGNLTLNTVEFQNASSNVTDFFLSGGATTLTNSRFWITARNNAVTNPNLTNRVDIRGGSLTMTGSRLDRTNYSGIKVNPESGSIDIVLTGDMTMNNSHLFGGAWGSPGSPISVSAANLFMNASSLDEGGWVYHGGDVTLNIANNITLANNSVIASHTNSFYNDNDGNGDPNHPGQAGNVFITAGGQLSLDSSLIDASNLYTTGVAAAGDVGNVTINVGSLVANNSGIFAYAAGGGRTGGNVGITTAGNATLNGQYGTSGIGTISTGWNGNVANSALAGNISLSIGGVLTSSGAALRARSRNGSGGNITATAGGALQMTGGYLDTSAQGGPAGSSGGAITLTAASLSSNNQSMTSSGTTGNGGSVHMTTTGAMQLTGINLNARSFSPDADNGGDVVLASGDFSMTNGFIQNESFGGGGGGKVTLNSSGTATFLNPQIVTGSSSAGQSGDINLTARNLVITEARFLSNNYSTGSSGGQSFTADRITISDSTVEASAESANGGAISLVGGDIDVRYSDLFNGSSQGQGGTLSASGNTVTLTGDYLETSSISGVSGDIAVTGTSLVIDSSWLYAHSSAGQGGNIILRGNDVTLTGRSDSNAQHNNPGFDPLDQLLFGHSYDSGTYLETSGSTGPLPEIRVEANTLTLEDNAYVLAARPDFELGPDGEHEVFSQWMPASGNITLLANTLNITQGANIIAAYGVGSATNQAPLAAGSITIGANTLNMTGGQILTEGPSGGVIRLSVNERMSLTGGTIHSSVATDTGDGIAGNIYVGTPLETSPQSNAACLGPCSDFRVFGDQAIPGAGVGVPVVFDNRGSEFAVIGQVGKIIYGSRGTGAVETTTYQAAPAEMMPSVEDANSDNTSEVEGDKKPEAPGHAYAYGQGRDPDSVCSAQASKARGRSGLAEKLAKLFNDNPRRMTMESDDESTAVAQRDGNADLACAAMDRHVSSQISLGAAQ